MNEFSHIDKNGKATMVDVSGKPVQQCKAVDKNMQISDVRLISKTKE